MPLIEKLGEEPFQAQCIPTSDDFLGVESYKRFLAERRRRIAERLNSFLGTQDEHPGARLARVHSDAG